MPNSQIEVEDDKMFEPMATCETFVDFVPPPRPPIPPPPKYKLCVAIFITIYFVAWFGEESRLIPALIDQNVMPPPGLSKFVLLMIQNFVMVFCGVELVVYVTRIKICETWYGFVPWFTQPRSQWIKESDNTIVEMLAIFVRIAEDGFEIFKPPMIPPPHPAVRVFDLQDKKKSVVLKSVHKIDMDKQKEYEEWVENMKSIMEMQPGFICCVRDSIDINTYTWLIKFKNIDALNNIINTSMWIKMIDNLGLFLDAPTVTQIMASKPPLNAFADILTRQGESSPILPPKKWKTYLVTLYSIYFSKFIADRTIERYFIQWGWNPIFHAETNPDAADSNWKPEVYRMVSKAFLVLLMNYIVTPTIQLLVSDWLHREPNEMDTIFPWKQLNDGVSLRLQSIGLITYFVVMGIAWSQAD